MLAVNSIRDIRVISVNAYVRVEEALLHIGNEKHLALCKVLFIHLDYSEALAVYGGVDKVKLVLINYKVGARLCVRRPCRWFQSCFLRRI